MVSVSGWWYTPHELARQVSLFQDCSRETDEEVGKSHSSGADKTIMITSIINQGESVDEEFSFWKKFRHKISNANTLTMGHFYFALTYNILLFM